MHEFLYSNIGWPPVVGLSTFLQKLWCSADDLEDVVCLPT